MRGRSPAAGRRPPRRRPARPRPEAGISWICGSGPASAGSGGAPRDGPGWRPRHVAGAATGGAGLRRAGTRTTGTRRGRGTGTGYGTGGRRGAAAGRSGAGTLGTLVNLRLLGNERHGLMSIKRRYASASAGGTWVRAERQKSKPSWPPISSARFLRADADLLEVPPLGQRIEVGPREPVVRGGAPAPPARPCARATDSRRWPRKRSLRIPIRTQFGHHCVALDLGDHRGRRDRDAGLVALDHRTDLPGRAEVVVLAVEDDRVGADRQASRARTAASRSAAVIPRSSISSGEACPRA